LSDPIAIPLIFDNAGPQPTPPANLRAALTQNVAAVVPGYTADLPGTLIEDISSTDVGALVTLDQARVDTIAGCTVYGATGYILAQLGIQLGIPAGQITNTSVLVQFSGPVGTVIPTGVIVTDGSYQYAVASPGGVIGSNGSVTLECVATQQGIWTPLANTVNQVVTTFPAGVNITCNNPEQGTPSTGTQTVQSYRAQILQAMQAPAQALANYLQSQIVQVSGVNPLQVNILQVSNGWEVICGGGDPYEVAGAIFASVGDLSTLVGSQISSTRNVNVTMTDGPNSYNIIYVDPPSQTVTCAVTWQTNLANFTATEQVNQLAAEALVAYFNSIPVGQPINLNVMDSVFAQAVAGIIQAANITALSYVITVNGSDVSPESGTQIILSDPESYYSAASNAVTVQQG